VSTANVRAARSALAVAASLLAGAGFAAVVRVALPRVLGPSAYGHYRLAESAAELVLILLTLGLDTTLRRDVAQRPEEAGLQLWGVVRLRARGGVVLAALGGLALAIGGASPLVLSLFVAFAAAQLVMSISNAHTATFHGLGDARWPAAVSVAARASWTVLALALLWWSEAPLLVAAALVAVEALRLLALHRRSVARHGPAPRATTEFRRAAWLAAAASLPIFVNFVAHSLYARLGLWVLGLRAPAVELGWYATATNVAGIALLGMPLVTWILLPAAASAGREAGVARDVLVAGALRAALLFAVPGAVLLTLLAGPLIVLLFGADYQPAVGVLQRLAPTIGLAYLATIAAVSLLERGRERVVAAISVAGLALSVILTVSLVHVAAPGAAAVGAATAQLLTEIAVTVTMLAVAWRSAWTRPVGRTALGLLAAAVVLVSLNVSLGAVSLAPMFRIAVLVLALPVLLVLFRAVDAADRRFARAVLFRQPAHAL
jgi:O-antigen/teichoic acid export membrane protein